MNKIYRTYKIILILFIFNNISYAENSYHKNDSDTFYISPNMGQIKKAGDKEKFFGVSLGLLLDSTSREDILNLDISHTSEISFTPKSTYDLTLIELDYLFNIYKMDFRMIDISRVWSEPDNKDINIYLLGGFGMQMLKNGNLGTDTSMILTGGTGVKYSWNRYVDFMAEYKNSFTADENIEKVTFGISFAFTPKDKKDYYSSGYDDDLDGISNRFDKCPNTPLKIGVDTDGCALDSDNDGVTDNKDLCPDTIKGFFVDKNGCQLDFNFYANFSIENIDLTFDSKIQEKKFFSTINKLVNFLKRNSEYNVELQGFTDDNLSLEDSKTVSRQKAFKVMQYILDRGVSRDRVSYRGYGQLMPIESNSIPFSKRKNNRVETYIYKIR